MPQSKRAQEARAARRAAKASQIQVLQQQPEQVVREGEPGATRTDAQQAVEPDDTACTSSVISNLDEVEREVGDLHRQLRSVLDRSQTLLVEWKEKEGGKHIVSLIEDMLHEMNVKLQGLSPSFSQARGGLDTTALLQQYSDALVNLVREKLTAHAQADSL